MNESGRGTWTDVLIKSYLIQVLVTLLKFPGSNAAPSARTSFGVKYSMRIAIKKFYTLVHYTRILNCWEKINMALERVVERCPEVNGLVLLLPEPYTKTNKVRSIETEGGHR